MLHFQSPIYPELAVKSFMTYLHRLNIFKLNEPANRLLSANSFPTLAALGACSVTSVAAVEVIFRTTCLQLGESLGPWRLFTRTADLETPPIKNSVPVWTANSLPLGFMFSFGVKCSSWIAPYETSTMSLYNFQNMLTLLRRTPALLPRGSIRLLASESAKVSQDLHSETVSPGPAPPQQNPLEARDYFGVFTVQSLAS